jgi:uncharacterized protein (TIGR03437 family)
MKAVSFGLLFLFASVQGRTQSYSVFTFDPPAEMTLIRVEALNTAGQVLGTYRDLSGGFHSLLRSANGSSYTTIQVPGAAQTHATGLNNLGQVAGSYTDAAGRAHSFVRDAGGTISTFDIPSVGGVQPPLPSVINDRGDVAGTAFSGALVETGFVLSADRATFTPLQVPGAGVTQVLGLNNNGDVAGTCQFGGSVGVGSSKPQVLLHHGFLRKADGTYIVIDGPGTSLETLVTAINNRGQVLANGMTLSSDGSTAGPDPSLAESPTAVDDTGRLAGCASSAGACRGFLAVPSSGAPPVIRPLRGVISASGYGGFDTIAPGSWIEIYGSNLAKTTRAWQSPDFNGNTAPTSLDGVRVTINGRRAVVAYISPGHVNALAPGSLTASMAQVTVENGGETSSGYPVKVAASRPGMLAYAQDVATTYALAIYPDYQTFAIPASRQPSVPPIPTRPAKAGDVLVLYGVGFGAVTPDGPERERADGAARQFRRADRRAPGAGELRRAGTRVSRAVSISTWSCRKGRGA